MINLPLEVHSLIPIYLLLITIGLSISCLITLFVPNDLCTIIPALTTYGKTADELIESYKLIQLISIPKRWFKHFYAIGLLVLSYCIHIMYICHTTGQHPSDELVGFLKMLTNKQPANITFTKGCFVMSLLLVHLMRRLYETLFVSIYSDSSMNLFHYFVGVVHYFILPLAFLSETSGIVDKGRLYLELNDLDFPQWIGALLFMYCNIEQHRIAEKIANTRRGPRGLVRNYAYGICFGRWFNYVSCPHFLFEILIYLSLWMVVPTAICFRYVVLFVVINQMFAAEITHRWYKRTFQKYPVHRKALIPFIF